MDQGVATYAAAVRFLRELRNSCSCDTSVYLAEAFLSFKLGRTQHSNDAKVFYENFWKTPAESLKEGIEPIMDIVEGIPSVRVFQELRNMI